MSRRQKDPLRELTEPERLELTRLARSQAAPAVEVIRAKLLLAVASGDDYQTAAHSVGRGSGDAVSHLVARFNAEGLDALTPRHGHWASRTLTLKNVSAILLDESFPITVGISLAYRRYRRSDGLSQFGTPFRMYQSCRWNFLP
jgi:hypothetical protein